MPGNSHPEHVSMSPSISFGNLYLQIERCPFCSTAIPSFTMLWNPIQTSAHDGSNQRSWAAYYCATCGGVVTACANLGTHIVLDYFPKSESISELIPQKPRHYLMEALNTVYSPSSSIMVCASSVDAMLKEKGYKTGTLYARINEAKDAHLITEGMATWGSQSKVGC